MASLLAADPFQTRKISSSLKNDSSIGLYVHIPFCDAKCHYCDFVTFTDQHLRIDRYLDALLQELEPHCGRSVKTFFLGGGTPTVLSVQQIQRLFNGIQAKLDFSHISEVTVEANPESANEERLDTFLRQGVNRISFGLQTTNNALLKSLGRLHDRDRFLQVYHLARRMGFTNINIDLMFGLPDQSLSDWQETLEIVSDLAPEHISAYALKVEPGTKLGKAGFSVDGDLEADMYLLASDFLTKSGYQHYEISNFSRPGYSSRHNLLYWENQDTLGIGVSSSSFLEGRRIKNTSSLTDYMNLVLSGKSAETESSSLSPWEQKKETIMLALRLREGIDAAVLREMKVPMAETFLNQGLAVQEKGMYSLTPKGWLLSNMLFQQFV